MFRCYQPFRCFSIIGQNHRTVLILPVFSMITLLVSFTLTLIVMQGLARFHCNRLTWLLWKWKDALENWVFPAFRSVHMLMNGTLMHRNYFLFLRWRKN